VKKSKKLNSMSQNKSMKNKSVIIRKASKKKILKSKKKISRRKTKIIRNKIKKRLRSKLVSSIAIASVKAAITATTELFRKKNLCMPRSSFTGVEGAVSNMITGLLITKSIPIPRSSITSKGSKKIIRDSNTVMMISMRLISLFIIEGGEARNIIMIGHSILSPIKCILLLWLGFKVKDITKIGLSKFLMDRG